MRAVGGRPVIVSLRLVVTVAFGDGCRVRMPGEDTDVTKGCDQSKRDEPDPEPGA